MKLSLVFITFSFLVSIVGVIRAASPESTPLYLRSAFPLWEPQSEIPSDSERLLLTPYLNASKVEEARRLARVGPGLFSDEIPSYAGYLTIDANYDSNLFFWFFPSQNKRDDAPLLLWLQGGPGASSLYGLFEEIGPFKTVSTSNSSNVTLELNPFSWNKNHSLIFIDNPVGTGFSYTKHNDGFATNHSTVAVHLYKALKQFFKMFYEFKDNDFYIVGESYGGKFIISLAHLLHQKNAEPTPFYINLKGIAVGNGFVDPETMLSYSEYTYQLGLIDINAKADMEKLEEQGKSAIKENHFIDAFYSWSGILSIFITETRFESLYNVLNEKWTWFPATPYIHFVQSPQIRRALHVGDAEYTSLGVVYYKMIPDFMSSVRSELETILDNYRVLIYNGQLDIICAYPLTLNLLNSLKCDSMSNYKKIKRRTWYVNGKLAGYVKTTGNFTEILVRNAGHIVPHDKPEWALDMITRFINNSTFTT